MKNMYRAFDSCSSLTKLPDGFTIPQGVTNLEGTFKGCSGLTSLPANFSIPNSVTNMGATFGDCGKLESLPENFIIPESVIYGYTRMFEGTSTQSGGTLTVNYSSNCANIDEILATGDSNYVKKGNLVE